MKYDVLVRQNHFTRIQLFLLLAPSGDLKPKAIMVTSADAVILVIKTIIFFASIAGNLLVGFVVFRNREMR